MKPIYVKYIFLVAIIALAYAVSVILGLIHHSNADEMFNTVILYITFLGWFDLMWEIKTKP